MNTTMTTPIEIRGSEHCLVSQATRNLTCGFTAEQLLGYRFFAEFDSAGFPAWTFELGSGSGLRVDLDLHGGATAKSAKNLPLPQAEPCKSLAAAGLRLRNRFAWRDVTPRQGSLRGLRHVIGQLIATDGIRGLLRRTDGSFFICHLTNFVEERSASTTPRRGHLSPLPAGLVV